jgi:uroporphyrinogen decarboxylase
MMAEMNSLERLTRRVRGEPVDRLPNCNIFMTFAARHSGNLLSGYYQDYRVLVEANLAVLEDFDLDIVQTISDPYREAADFGLEVEFPRDGLPIAKRPLLAEPDDIRKLDPPDPSTGRRMSDRLAATRLLREQVGGEVPIMGWVEGALAEAVDLRGMNDLFMDLILRPDWAEELLEICTEQAIAFARAQVEAGADIIGLGDAAASQISPEMYRRFALPYEKRIFAAVHEKGALARLHICGDSGKIVDGMVESGADIIDLDWMVDMRAAGEQFGSQVSLLGNFDPVTVMLQGTPDEVYQATLDCARTGGPRSISAAGCEIPMDTPHENLQAHARALRDLGAA